MKSLLETLQSGSGYLEDRGIDEARLNMEHIIANVLGCERIELYLAYDRPMQEKELKQLRSYLKRRGQREPLQHILGSVEFMGHDFISDSRALIPRPETEELVGILLNQFSSSIEPSRILDVGCGSGVIGISLAIRWKDSHVTMVDCSEDALSLSKENAINLKLMAHSPKLHRPYSHSYPRADIQRTERNSPDFDISVSQTEGKFDMDNGKSLQSKISGNDCT